jgi:hypothetical protein
MVEYFNETKSTYIEIVGFNNYCLKEPIIIDQSSNYTLSFKIGRISDKSYLSFGLSEEYLIGKHYDILVGFGFGVFGFKPNGEFKIDDYLDSSTQKFYFTGNKLPSLQEGYIVNYVINSTKLKLYFNEVLQLELELPKISLYYCFSGATYRGISTVEILPS